MYMQDSQSVQATIADMSSTGDKVTLTPAFPVEIVSIGAIITTVLVDAAGGMVMKLDKRITAGTDTGRTDGTLGTLTLTSAQANSLAAGDVTRSRPEITPSDTVPTESALVVLPGQQAILELTTAVDSGAGIGFIEFRQLAKLDRATTIEVVVAA